MLLAVLSIVGGLVVLVLGGEWLVKGAVAISIRLGLPTLITGLVVVGAATSMPEMVASLSAALAGAPDIGWGNIAGSNIANILLILGAVALLTPIPLRGIGRRDAVAGIMAAAFLYGITLAGVASIAIGLVFLVLLIVYVVWRYAASRKRGDVNAAGHDEHEFDDEATVLTMGRAVFYLAIGVAGLVIGGNFLIDGSVIVATRFGLSETVIGLTVVAIGTSLPELAASATAAYRGQPGLALGNVLGSNIYNILLIGGATMLAAPSPVTSELLDLELPLLLVSSLILWALLHFASRISRWMGAVLLAMFVGNSVYVLTIT